MKQDSPIKLRYVYLNVSFKKLHHPQCINNAITMPEIGAGTIILSICNYYFIY